MTLTEIFAKVLNMSLTASLVILLVLASRFVLRKSPKVFSYVLWAVVLFRLLCPVSIPSPVSLLGLLDAPVAESEGLTTTVEYIPYTVVESEVVDQPQISDLPQNTTAQAPIQSQQTAVEPQREPMTAAEIMTYIWLAGCSVMVIVGVGSYLRFRKHLTGAMQVKDNIYLVDHIDSAFVAGLICPKIYLPSDIPVKQMGYIIAHEQYHIRRLDHVTKHLSFAALCIHWFNPLVWVAFVMSGKDLEMSCDEAVIKRLGEGIRADYSASLLNLATGRRIIAGTPLAFGEGDTKGRIKNMANWKQPKKWVSIVSFILCFSILTACAANPEQEVVVNRNDGSFDVNLVQSATSPTVPYGSEGTMQNYKYNETFSSTDGSVDFTFEIDTDITTAAMPAVEIVPHYLTGEDAKRVATALFGDAEFYEKRPSLAPIETIYYKSEVQQMLTDWASYADIDFLINLYGEKETAQNKLELIKKFIADFTEKYDSFPEEDTRVPCKWQLQPDFNYYYSPEEAAEQPTDEANDAIQAEIVANGIEYTFGISTRYREDFKINNIHVTLTDGTISPSSIALRILQSQLCRTEKPTETQVNAVQAKAEGMLSQMQLGNWKVDECSVITTYYGDIPEYYISVTAVPVLNGVPAFQRNQLGNLGNESAYNSSYYITTTNFRFSPDGHLISFEMTSTIDVKEVINDHVATLTMDELMEKAKTQFSLSDRGAYFLPLDLIEMFESEYGEEIGCRIVVNKLDYGLTRVKVPNSNDSYYYLPGVLLSGYIEYYGKTTGTIYDSSDLMVGGKNVPYELLCLNAVDGSVIAQRTR